VSLNTNLEAFWKLADTSDASGNSRTLTNNGVVTFVAGKVGNAAQLTAASTQYLSRADEAGLSFGNEDFSLSAWFYLDSLGVARPIINKNTTEWRLGVTAANKVIWQLPSTNLTHSLTLSVSTWYHVVATYDATANLMAVIVNDGTPETAADSTGATDSTNELRIGRLGTAYWNGKLDAIGMWRRVLTAAEITQLYAAGSGIEPPFASAYTATLTETLTGADSLARATGRALAESLTAADALAKATARALAEGPTLADTVARDVARTLADGAGLTDSVARALARELAESSTLTDSLTRAVALELAEAMGVADSLSRDLALVLLDAYAANEGRLDGVARTLTESLGLSDSITAQLVILFGRVVRPQTELATPIRTTESVTPKRTTELS
jgi:hypothetical protein